jgi:C4-dicarboxylate transporter DctQ subunit
LSRFMEKIEYTSLIASLSIMSLITFLNVLSRYVLNYSLAFTEEITLNLFVFITFMGAAVGIHRKAHLGFTLLFDYLGHRSKLAVTCLIGLIGGITFFIITFFGVKMVLFQMGIEQITPALGWPQWILSLGLPLGSLFCLLRTIESTIKGTWLFLDRKKVS